MSNQNSKVDVVIENDLKSDDNLEKEDGAETKNVKASSWIRKATDILGGERMEAMLDEPKPVQVSLQKSPDALVKLQIDKKEPKKEPMKEPKPRPQPAKKKPVPGPKEDLRTGLLQDRPAAAPSGSKKCSCLSWLKCDDEPCIWADFLKCGEQWEKRPALKYVRIFCVALPAIVMIVLQIVNSAQGNSLTETWCLRPRDKDGFGPLFVNIFFYWGWGDAIGMTIVYCLIAASVMLRGNRVFLLSCLFIIISYGLLYWGLALSSDCQAGASTLNLGLAFFNITQAGLEFWWKIDIDYYALGASLVTFITYLALLFKNVIPDAHTSLWAHLFSSIAGVVVSIAYAWRRHRRLQREKDGRTVLA